jgi:hypothetical protein
MWPCQVTGAADAERQEPVLRAIVECGLHERIFQGTWQVIPAFTAQAAPRTPHPARYGARFMHRVVADRR